MIFGQFLTKWLRQTFDRMHLGKRGHGGAGCPSIPFLSKKRGTITFNFQSNEHHPKFT